MTLLRTVWGGVGGVGAEKGNSWWRALGGVSWRERAGLCGHELLSEGFLELHRGVGGAFRRGCLEVGPLSE